MRGFQKVFNQMFNQDIILPKQVDKNTYNFFSPINTAIPANSSVKIDTGITVIFKNEEYLKFEASEVLYLNQKIVSKQRMINEYDAILTLINTSDEEFIINKGDIICKAIFQRA
jgi:dUTPase